MKSIFAFFISLLVSSFIFSMPNLPDPLTQSELKALLHNQKLYGYSNRSKKPYTVEFKENNQLIINIDGKLFEGSYSIIDVDGLGMVTESYTPEQEHYVSENPESLYSPQNKHHKLFTTGKHPLGPFYFIDTGSTPRKILVHKQPIDEVSYSYEIIYLSSSLINCPCE